MTPCTLFRFAYTRFGEWIDMNGSSTNSPCLGVSTVALVGDGVGRLNTASYTLLAVHLVEFGSCPGLHVALSSRGCRDFPRRFQPQTTPGRALADSTFASYDTPSRRVRTCANRSGGALSNPRDAWAMRGRDAGRASRGCGQMGSILTGPLQK